MTGWISVAKTASCTEVAQSLGLDLRRRHLTACPLCGSIKQGSGKVYRAEDGAERWHCFRCDAGGDMVDLVSYRLHGAALRDLDKTTQNDVREWFAKLGYCEDDPGVARGRPRPPARTTAQHPLSGAASRGQWRVPQRELLALVEATIPVIEDSQVATWLLSRGLDPDIVAGRNLARVLPLNIPLPRWAHLGRLPWTEGWRCLFPAWGPSGQLESVRARWIRSEHPPGRCPKACAAAAGAGSASGLVLGNGRGRLLLEMATPNGGDPTEVRQRLVISEGEPDFLTQATIRPDQEDCAVLGVWSGGWTQEIADRVPDGSRVTIRTHNDNAGDHYVDQILSTLRGRCFVLRSVDPATEREHHDG